MPSILVVEQELRYIERITAALTAEGWQVRVVPGRAEALQEAASHAPDLLVASAAIPGVEALAATFSRSAGGPGVVALLPEDAAQAGTGGVEADELLAKPFTGQELSVVVRRVLAARREAPAPQARGDEPKLTSADIFGDMLAEVESAVDEADAEILPPPASAAAARPAAGAHAAGISGGDDEMRRRLEQTLSGVLNTAPRTRPVGKPTPPAAPAARRGDTADADLDALINRTLSGLGGSSRPPARPAPPAPAPAPPAITPVPPRTAPGPAVPPPAAAKPAAAVQPPVSVQPPAPVQPQAPIQPPVPVQPQALPPPPAPVPPAAAVPIAKPVAVPIVPPAKAAVAAPSPPAPAATEGTGTGVRKDQRVVGDFDFSEIEELARTRTRTGPAPARPATVPALGSTAVPAPVPSGGAPEKPPVRVDASTQRIAVIPAGQRPGERFGQYTLLEKIAVGGMAEVWKARMSGVEGFQKTVAIKKILPHLTDNAEFIGMFIDEAKLAAQLSHPNIIHIYDLGKIGRDYYIAMEYVEGKDLRSLLNAGRSRRLPVPLGLAVLIAERLASALDYAHRKRDFEDRELGLVHRDVSPQNVLITSHGDIKLCDFGIAKAVSKASQTQLGALKGKLQYMSPEQAWGKTVDARSDIFSLGAILFELLTGERLFPGDSEIGVLEAVRDGRVRGPREIDPSIPPEVEAVVQKALARDPDARFANAGEMQVRLERILQADKPTPTATDLAAYVQSLLAPPAAEAPAAVAAPTPAPPALPEPPPAAPFAAAPPLPLTADAAAVLPEAALADESAAVAATAGTAAEVDPTEPADLAAVAPLGPLTVEDSERRGRLVLWAAIVVLVLLGVAGYFLFGRFKQSPPAPAPAPAVTATPAVPPPVAPAEGTQPVSAATPAPAAAGAGRADVAGMVDQELAKREQELKAKYVQEQKRLEKELTLARQNGKPVPPGAGGVAPGAVIPPPAQETARPTEPEAAPPPAPAPAVVPPPAAEPQPEPEPPAAARAAEPPPAAKAQVGDLVVGGPGVAPPVLVSSQQPGYPPIARKMKVEGTVVVSVLVDENGRVKDAKLAEPLKRDFGINQAALEVARTARYRPATKDGARVKMWIRLKIPFKL